MPQPKGDLSVSLVRLPLVMMVFAISALLVTVGTAWNHYYWRYIGSSWEEASLFYKYLSSLDLANEDVVGSWFSSMLLLLTATMAAMCFIADTGRVSSRLRAGWLVAAAIFLGLSLDEMGSIHERLPFHLGTFMYVVWLGPVFIAIPVYMSVFAWLRLRQIPTAFYLIIAGALILSTIPVQERFETSIKPAGVDSDWQRPIVHIALEEGAELAGVLCFLAAFSVSAYQLAHVSSSGAPFIVVSLGASPWSFPVGVSLAASVMAIGSNVLERMVAEDQWSGTPTNWPPSAFAFLTAIASIFLARGRQHWTEMAAVLAIGSSCLSISVAAAVTRFGTLSLVSEMALALILCSAAFFAAASVRSRLLFGSLAVSAYIIHLAPDWRAGNYLLISSVLLSWSLFLWARVGHSDQV